MSIIPGGVPSNLPIFRITCDGVALPVTAELIALETMQSASGDASATLRFVAIAADRAWSAVSEHAPLGARLEIALGYGTQADPVFAGSVCAHRLSVASAGLPEWVLEAASTSVPATPQDEVVLDAVYGATLLALEATRTQADATAVTGDDIAAVMQGHATLLGTTRARPGGLLALRGVGDDFSGDVRIVAVHHRFSRDGWTTRLDVRADAGQG